MIIWMTLPDAMMSDSQSPNVMCIIGFPLYETFKEIKLVAEKRSLVVGVTVGERT